MDIRDNIDRILLYTQDLDKAAFFNDALKQDAVERCLERVAEASIKLGPVVRERLPDHPWDDIRSFGNHLRHEYDNIDVGVIWSIVTLRLPKLREDVQAIIDSWL